MAAEGHERYGGYEHGGARGYHRMSDGYEKGLNDHSRGFTRAR